MNSTIRIWSPRRQRGIESDRKQRATVQRSANPEDLQISGATSAWFACPEPKARRLPQFRRCGSDEKSLEQFEDATNLEVNNDLMMLHALAALDRTQVSHKTVMTIAHPSQSAIPEHRGSMHRQMIQSNLDDKGFRRFA